MDLPKVPLQVIIKDLYRFIQGKVIVILYTVTICYTAGGSGGCVMEVITGNYLSVANRYRFMREVGTDECTQGNSTWRCYSLVSLKIELRSIHCATCGK